MFNNKNSINKTLKLAAIFFVSFFMSTVSIEATELANNTANKKQRMFVVGFAQDTMNNDWRAQQVKEVEKVFAEHSNIRFIATDAHAQTAKQILDIKNLVKQGIDLLITSPRDGKALAPVISETFKKGIPVILLERGVESNNYTTLIGPNNITIAKQAANALGKKLKGKGRIFMLKGVATATPTIQRTQGFESALSAYPNMKIVASKVANYLRGDAIKATEAILKSNIKFDAIYAHSDSMATGARMALIKAGIKPGSIPIIGIDYIKEAREAIRNGEQEISFTYPTSGKEGAEYAVKILNGQKVPKKILIPSVRVDKSNVEKVNPIF